MPQASVLVIAAGLGLIYIAGTGLVRVTKKATHAIAQKLHPHKPVAPPAK
jgi:hypothetical protein